MVRLVQLNDGRYLLVRDPFGSWRMMVREGQWLTMVQNGERTGNPIGCGQALVVTIVNVTSS